MNLTNVRVVFWKELIDHVRDRRTLISMVVVPILLFPVLTIGVGALGSRLVKKARAETARIMILGAEGAPELAAHLRTLEGFEVVPPSPDYAELISDKQLRAAIELPADFEQKLRTLNAEPPVVKIYYHAGELRSRFAMRSLDRELTDYRDRVAQQRLRERDLPANLLEPFATEESNVAPPEKVSGGVIGGFIPYFFIILALTGAAYPAMDLTAGEKERGTIETILASPISRLDLVLGKFLMVLLASITTTLLAIVSFAGTFLLSGQALSDFLGKKDGSNMPFVISAQGVVAVFLMVLPLAVLFSAALLALSLLAKSYKEAQTYTQPLIFVVLLPAIAALLPGVELNARLALVPILNVSLVSKEILTGNYPWGLIGLIFLSSCVYAAAALFVAVRAFQREEVLFRS